MRIYHVVSLLVGMAVASLCAAPQNETLVQQLAAQYRLSTVQRGGQITAAGSTLVLQKSGLVMYAVSNPNAPTSNYKNGKISKPAFGGFLKDLGDAMNTPGASAQIDQRVAAAGEKVLVSKIDIQKDGVLFRLYDGTGYFGELKFPFAKNTAPPAEQLLATIGEALVVQPDQAPPAAPAETAVAPPTAAPEQQAAAPATLTLGMTVDQVVGLLGQPERAADLGSKKIYSYKDMKITFLDGKVSGID